MPSYNIKFSTAVFLKEGDVGVVPLIFSSYMFENFSII